MKTFICLLILTIFLISGCVSQKSLIKSENKEKELLTENNKFLLQNSELSKQLETNSFFIKEYTITITNIHVASNYIDMAQINLDLCNVYVQGEEYYYDIAVDYLDSGKEQALDAKELLNKAKNKLENLKNSTPNTFLQEDLNNRLEQINKLILRSQQTYDLLEYNKQQLYEINYGSESKADVYLDKYNKLILEYNANLKNLSDIQNKIDLNWDQDWYPTFQEESTI